jgi:hypothetical protein
MTTGVKLVQLLLENNTADIRVQNTETALKIIDLVMDIGFDYIGDPEDALDYAKRINLIKREIKQL